MNHARKVLLAVSALAIGFALYAMGGRLGYGGELEWMTGSMLDHVERVRAGQPLYTPPSSDWIPFLYPPLYYWVTAVFAKWLPLHVAARSVSIVSTFAQAFFVQDLARAHGASRAWRFVAVGLFFGAFGYAGYWYDLERVDSLFMAMVLAAVWIVVRFRGNAAAAIAGAILGLSFLAKQPATLFVAGTSVGLWLAGQRVRAAIFAAAAAIAAGPIVWNLHRSTDGWFTYYVLKMPGAHGMDTSLVENLLLVDLPRGYALFGVGVALFAAWAIATRLAKAGRVAPSFVSTISRDSDALLACATITGAAAAVSSRLHVGGWENVFMFFVPFACVAIAVVGERVATSTAARWPIVVFELALALQMVVWTYDPTAQIPRRATIEDARRLRARVAELEKSGDVLVVGFGHMTARRHFHEAALIDVLRTTRDVPAAIADPFRRQSYAAIVIDAFADLTVPVAPQLDGKLFDVVIANYYVAERLDPKFPPRVVGWTAKPSWLLLPRKERLDENDRELLRRRQRVEAALAESAERLSRATGAPVRAGDVEAAARQACDALFAGAPRGEHFVPDPIKY